MLNKITVKRGARNITGHVQQLMCAAIAAIHDNAISSETIMFSNLPVPHPFNDRIIAFPGARSR